VPLDPPHLIADAVHGDPEEPRLKPALLGVPALPQLGRDGRDHFRQLVVANGLDRLLADDIGVVNLVLRVRGNAGGDLGEVPADIRHILFRAAEAAFVETFGNPDWARVDRGGCFAGGCLFFVTVRDSCAERDFKQLFSDKAHTRLHSWPGPVYRSPPLKGPDGQLHETWALLLYETPDRQARLAALLQPPQAPLGGIRPEACASANNPAPKDNPAPKGVK